MWTSLAQIRLHKYTGNTTPYANFIFHVLFNIRDSVTDEIYVLYLFANCG
jgi:hypothetical protein